ncbi:Zinc finger protein [Vanrija pseudolonga]|uniref:Zinc finger protein n=1 Tax=Vanrija pseudolonga TaxID=143232 RepID=A0AAF0YAV1_9TREE|nr:Zinc finger protein [Vanrija pseudolonga]
MEYTCGTCAKVFPAGRAARDKHTAATGHKAPRHECGVCSLVLSSAGAVAAHQAEANHFPFACRDPLCAETWPTGERRDKHELEAHRFCGPCKRRCDTDANLRMHLNSAAHRPSNLACPQCSGRFASATGLAHHLERACGRQLDRQAVLAVVAPRDPNGWFSSDAVRFVRAPRQAPEGSWNGTAYRCAQVGCGREFAELALLSAHLASPDHDEPVFVCYAGCGRQFLALSAIFNHLESDGCGGEVKKRKPAGAEHRRTVSIAGAVAGAGAVATTTTATAAARPVPVANPNPTHPAPTALRDTNDGLNRRASTTGRRRERGRGAGKAAAAGGDAAASREKPAAMPSPAPTRDSTPTPTPRLKAAKPRPMSIRGLPAR